MNERRSKPDDRAERDLSNGPVLTPDEAQPDEPIPPESTSEESPRSIVLPQPDPTPTPDPEPEPLPDPVPATDGPASDPVPECVSADLEQRVRRLEEALALIQQGRPFVTPTPLRGPVSTQKMVPAPGATHLTADPPTSPVPPTAGAGRPVPAVGPRTPGWLFWEMFIELRVFLRMYTDPRYQMSWYGRTVPAILLFVFIFSEWVVPFSSLLGVGWLFRKGGELIVLYVLVKSLSYEARRYRQTAPDLPASMRL